MKVEVEKFSDGRLKLLVRFEKSSNFWVEVESITWVPSKPEVELISEALKAIDDQNIVRRGLGRKVGNYRL